VTNVLQVTEVSLSVNLALVLFLVLSLMSLEIVNSIVNARQVILFTVSLYFLYIDILDIGFKPSIFI
jgi:hypothetical protein